MIVAQVSTPVAEAEVVNYQFPRVVDYGWQDDRPMLALWRHRGPFWSEGYFEGSRAAGAPHAIGSIMFVPSGRMLVSRGSGGPVSAVRLRFDNAFFSTTLEGRDTLSDALLDSGLDIRRPRIRSLFHSLMGELTDPGFGSSAVVESLSTLLLMEWARETVFTGRSVAKGSISPANLRLIDEMLRDVDGTVPSIATLAELCGMKPRTFSAAFRRQTGRPLRRCIADSQLAKAQQMLLYSDLALKEIAFRSGFSSAANFSTAFRNAVGMAPGAFRREHGNAHIGFGHG